ncbi:MAG: type II toxin-antitoxin system HicB family antitoxin [Anaerolineae bacterium]|nr:type II toxin-antitoxin system HicB family antitoxin [Anaerolineae bacterium]
MNEQLLERAKQLASRNYSITIESDVLSDGKPVFIARNPELEGCKSQGHTPDEAKTNLDLARIDYIYSLLEDGITPPEPIASNETQTGNLENSITYHVIVSDNTDVELETLPQKKQVPLYQASA